MPDMLRHAERDRLIAFMERNLARGLTLPGTPAGAESDTQAAPQAAVALRETTASLPTAALCWTADAAATAEVLALPAVRPRWAALGDGLAGYLLAMGEGALLHRRASTPGCVVSDPDPQDFHILAHGYEFTGNLARGVLRQEVAGMAGRRAVLHTGHLVEFSLGRQSHCLDVEDAITRYGLTPVHDGVVLFHESRLAAPAGWLRRRRTLGVLRYEYFIRAHEPRLRLRVTLRTGQGVALRDVRLTTALDEMSAGSHPIGHAVLEAGGRHVPLPLRNPVLATLHQGPADSLSLVEDTAPGGATGLHLRFASGARLQSLKLTARAPGEEGGGAARPHWLLARYGVPLPGGGQAVTIEEERLLTAGTLAGAEPDYAAQLRDPARLEGRDPGASIDSGVALNAVATQLLFAARGAYEDAHMPAPARLAALQAWYERQAHAFFAAMADSPGADAPVADVTGAETPGAASPGAVSPGAVSPGAVSPGAGPACADTPPAGTVALLRAARVALRPLAFALLSLDTMLRRPGVPQDGPHARMLAVGLEALLARQLPPEAGGAFTEQGADVYLDCHAAALLALARLALRQPAPRIATALRQGLAALQLSEAEAPGGTDGAMPGLRARRPEGQWSRDDGTWTFKLALLMRALNMLDLARQAGAVPLEAAEQRHLDALRDTCLRLLRQRVRATDDTLEVLTSATATEGNAATQPLVLLALLSPDEAVLDRVAAPLAVEA